MSPYLSRSVETDGRNACESDTKATFPHIDADPALLPSSLDPFTITTHNGYLPLQAPLVDLPAAFRPISILIEKMPVTKGDGCPGLLASYQLGPAIDGNESLPDLTAEVDYLIGTDGNPDLAAVTAVFRDYSFLASAYLLEPCWERFNKGFEDYGLGRVLLPHCIAGPMVKAARLLDIPPFLSYAASYALYNYRYADLSIGNSEYSNLRLIRAFEYGLDPSSSESGFILTHVDMVKHSPGLIQGTVSVLDAVAADIGRAKIASGFEVLLSTMEAIEASMEAMWSQSKPKHYISYRTFLFGITNQSMFPNGVVYENINDNRPMHFRGESGANDSIIPLLDALLEIPMPQNPLTDILKDFRNYRPKPHRDFLAYVRQRAEQLGVRGYCCKHDETAVLYLRLLEHVRSFRWRHWMFTREYILKQTSHPTASGGSPIVTWLPNQLFAVMELMTQVWHDIAGETKADLGKDVHEMMQNVQEQYGKLGKEVERYCMERGV